MALRPNTPDRDHEKILIHVYHPKTSSPKYDSGPVSISNNTQTIGSLDLVAHEADTFSRSLPTGYIRAPLSKRPRTVDMKVWAGIG